MFRVYRNLGYLFRGPYNQDYGILGSILGSPYLWKLPPGDLGGRASASEGQRGLGGLRVWAFAWPIDALCRWYPQGS